MQRSALVALLLIVAPLAAVSRPGHHSFVLVLMVQIENEYGSYGNDTTYLEAIRSMWLKNGIDVPFYTADGAAACSSGGRST